MNPRLLVKLPSGWQDVSHEVPDGGATFVKGGTGATSALQVSYGLTQGMSTEAPDLSEEQLIVMASQCQIGENCGNVVQRYGGPSLFGKMGTAIYRGGKYPRVQIWFLSNGKDLIMASHIAAEEPGQELVEEAERIVENLALLPGELP